MQSSTSLLSHFYISSVTIVDEFLICYQFRSVAFKKDTGSLTKCYRSDSLKVFTSLRSLDGNVFIGH